MGDLINLDQRRQQKQDEFLQKFRAIDPINNIPQELIDAFKGEIDSVIAATEPDFTKQTLVTATVDELVFAPTDSKITKIYDFESEKMVRLAGNIAEALSLQPAIVYNNQNVSGLAQILLKLMEDSKEKARKKQEIVD